MGLSREYGGKFTEYSPAKNTRITKRRLRDVGLLTWRGIANPEDRKGQNFLIDGTTMNIIADCIEPDSTVIEVGSGAGLLTEVLSAKGNKVFGMELDSDFRPILSRIHDSYPNTLFATGDALKALDLASNRISGERKIQVVSNLPFYIARNFMAKLVGARIHNAVFFLGDEYARQVTETDTQSPDYGHMSLIANTFFNTEIVADVREGRFYPMPQTTGKVVVIAPLSESDLKENTSTHIISDIIRDTQGPKPPSVLQSIAHSLETTEAAFLEKLISFTPDDTTFGWLQKGYFELENNEVGKLAELIDMHLMEKE